MTGVETAILLKIAAGFAGGIATLLYLRRYVTRRTRDVRRMVDGGEATWAANCRITKGADFLADAEVTAAPQRYPAGYLVATANRLEWRPDGWSMDVGWRPGSRPLTDVRLLETSWRRDITGIRLRVLRFAVPDGEIHALVAAEAGHPPRNLEADTAT